MGEELLIFFDFPFLSIEIHGNNDILMKFDVVIKVL